MDLIMWKTSLQIYPLLIEGKECYFLENYYDYRLNQFLFIKNLQRLIVTAHPVAFAASSFSVSWIVQLLQNKYPNRNLEIMIEEAVRDSLLRFSCDLLISQSRDFLVVWNHFWKLKWSPKFIRLCNHQQRISNLV